LFVNILAILKNLLSQLRIFEYVFLLLRLLLFGLFGHLRITTDNII